MQVLNCAELSAERLTAIERELSGQENLLDVLTWVSQNPADFLPAIVADVIKQDEFTHDTIVPWLDLFLVYDTT